MSLETALKIFTEQGFSDPQWVVDTIKKAKSLDELNQIMIDEKTDLGADQFVSLRMKSLFKGDLDFAKKTVAEGKKRLSDYGVPVGVIDYYFKELPEALFQITFNMELGKEGLPLLGESDKDFNKVKDFLTRFSQRLLDACGVFLLFLCKFLSCLLEFCKLL